MPDLSFQVESAEAASSAIAPQIDFKLRVIHSDADRDPNLSIGTVVLRCMVRIEPSRRRYAAESQDRLVDLFGTSDLWSKTVRSMLWTNTSVVVPPFTGSTLIDLPVPCTFDFNVAVTKYFHALDDGEVPLSLLFSGTIFYTSAEGKLQIAQVPWDKEASFRLPVAVWKEMMHHHYSDSAWLSLRRDVFDRLLRYKSRQAMPSWEQAIESLLSAEESVTP
jgi:hypothetical protein